MSFAFLQTPQSVPLRVGVACAVQALGSVLGACTATAVELMEFATPEARLYGYELVFVLASVLTLLAFFYTVFFVTDTYHMDRTGPDAHTHRAAAVEGSAEVQESRRTAVRFRPLASFRAVAQVALQRRPGWERFCLNFLIASVFVEMALFGKLIN